MLWGLFRWSVGKSARGGRGVSWRTGNLSRVKARFGRGRRGSSTASGHGGAKAPMPVTLKGADTVKWSPKS